MKRFSFLLALPWVGCEDWPIHEGVDFEHDGLPSDLSDSEVLSVLVDWGDPVLEEENNDYPRHGELIDAGEGWHLEGELTGMGWDATAEPDFVSSSACDAVLAFPPLTSGGDYSGDIEWFGLQTRSRGTLCLSVELNPGFEANSLRYDIMLYRLNACGDPVEIIMDEDLDKLGFGAGGDRTSWATSVDESAILGLVLAGYSPNDLEEEVPWKIALSLLDIPTGGTCPTPPWR